MAETKAEQIVSSYVDLLVASGVRQATIDAVARRCSLTRAGLLHHHGSRAAMDAALLARLEALVDEDVTAMASSPEGPAVYYLTSSFAAQSPLERTVVAATRLAQAGSAEAARALRDARDRWYGLIREEVLDPVVAKFVLLAGDGVSHQTDIRGEGDDEEFVSAEDIAALGALLARLRRS